MSYESIVDFIQNTKNKEKYPIKFEIAEIKGKPYMVTFKHTGRNKEGDRLFSATNVHAMSCSMDDIKQHSENTLLLPSDLGQIFIPDIKDIGVEKGMTSNMEHINCEAYNPYMFLVFLMSAKRNQGIGSFLMDHLKELTVSAGMYDIIGKASNFLPDYTERLDLRKVPRTYRKYMKEKFESKIDSQLITENFYIKNGFKILEDSGDTYIHYRICGHEKPSPLEFVGDEDYDSAIIIR